MSGKTLEETVKEKEPFAKARPDYYRDFQLEEGIPVFKGFHIDDLRSLELQPWSRMGGQGAFVNLYGEETWGDNYVCEIPAGQSLNPQRHLFEELVYVLSGRGRTTFWARPDGPQYTLEWSEQSVFALPANMGFQHHNADGTKPARLFAKTTLPALFQYFKEEKFIFENDSVLEEIQSDLYSAEPRIYHRGPPDYMIAWAANLVPDIRSFDKLTDNQSRGAGGKVGSIFPPSLVRLRAHQSEFPVGTYKKAHAHPPGRSIIIITGKGFSLLWQPGREKEKRRVDWHPGSLLGVGLDSLQGECWYHQHFNTGKEPARYLVFHGDDSRLGDKHIKVDYVDEDPEIRKLFESELAKSGLSSRMPTACYSDRNFKWKG